MALLTNVKPIPVLPNVPSTTIPFGSSSFFSSASSIIPRAVLSLTDPPGFKNSALPYISQPVISDGYFNLIRGVFPIKSIIYYSES